MAWQFALNAVHLEHYVPESLQLLVVHGRCCGSAPSLTL